MNEVAEGIATFIYLTDEYPPPPDATTLDVLRALRAHLDVTVPGWRGRVVASGVERNTVNVEVRLRSGRVVRGALFQQASTVPAE